MPTENGSGTGRCGNVETDYVHPETGEVLATHDDWMRALAAVEDALAGPRPDVGHHRDDVEPIGDAVVGVPDVGLRRDGADVPVFPLESTFPVVVPAFIAVEVAREQGAFAHHDPVIDGLGPGGHGKRETDENRRQLLDHDAA